MRLLRLALGLALILTACGQEPATTPADGRASDRTPQDAADAHPLDAADDPVDPVDPPLPQVVCPVSPTGITLGISALSSSAAFPALRLAVVFLQLDDDIKPYPDPVLGLDLPLAALGAGETACLDVDLAQIVAPTADALQLCTRDCPDLTDPACACSVDQPRAAIGYVVAMSDLDGNGRLDPPELAKLRGGAWMGIGASPAARAPQPRPSSILDFVFPEGLEPGVRPYRVLDTDRFDQLAPHQPGTTYQLRLCTGSERCKVLPNLT